MVQEKNLKAMSGYPMIALAIACLAAFIVLAIMEMPLAGIPFMFAFPF